MTKVSSISLKDFKKALLAKGRLLGPVEKMLFQESLVSNRDTLHLHPSEISKKDWCPRSSYYTITSEKPVQTNSFKKLNIFAEGNAIHHKWQTWLAKCGILEGNWYCTNCDNRWWEVSTEGGMRCAACDSADVQYREVPIQNEEYRLLGHADGIIWDKDGRAVLEIKSVGLGTLRYESPELFAKISKGTLTLDEAWKEIRSPFLTHLRQVNLYMYCLGLTQGVVLYEWKPSQDVKEFQITFQQHLIDSILAGCSTVTSALAAGRPPMRPMNASLDASFCKSCPFYSTCWSIDEDHTNSSEPDPIRSADETGTDDSVTPRIIRRPQ